METTSLPASNAPSTALNAEPAHSTGTPKPNHNGSSKITPGPVRNVATPKAGGQGRKPKACVECKKHKMRCDISPGDQKCRNCVRRKKECSFRPGVAMGGGTISAPGFLMEIYEKKIDAMDKEMKEMKKSIEILLRARPAVPAMEHSEAILEPVGGTPHSITSRAALSSTRENNTQMAMTRENSIDPDLANVNTEVLVEEPMGSLYEVTRLRNIRSNLGKTARPTDGEHVELNDFISRGVISEVEAEELYKSFFTSLNHYLWVGLEQTHPSFYSVRKSSELLTATILTVTALHIPTSSETFDKCYREFLTLIASSMFSRYHSIDDVRALCIAAFWLSDVSWKLSGHAIRIATELNIHQSFTKALEGDREHFQRARLWYMLYVCDHHFSIAYGRPPMIAESIQIRELELFLLSPFADAIDARILSQVALMRILTRIFDRFGERRLPDYQTIRDGGGVGAGNRFSTSSMLQEEDFVDVRNFNLEIEQWRMRWHARQRENSFIGTFPPKGIILYSYFAKLQLNILAVRGVSIRSGELSTERKELTNMAISAASSILTLILEEPDLRRALIGTPLYVHMMVAFASVFLMKVATKWNRIMGFNIEHSYANVSRLLRRMIELLKSSVTSDRHVLHHIAAGLEKMLRRMTVSMEASEPASRQSWGSEPSQQGGVSSRATEYGTRATGGGFGLPQGTPMNMQSSGLADDQVGGDERLFGGPRFMDDELLFEAFGTDASNDVYSMLTSHFL